jgi:hypothetical protein
MNNHMNMTKLLSYVAVEDLEKDRGCAYIVDESGGDRRPCGATRQLSSSYCSHHHSLCHIVCGSKAETDRLREVEVLASAVGGRRARRREAPTRQFLKRLEQAVRELF